uniref:Uncharacterized protein n=1 Tax=Timema tahoe TaxID=61484 RepID=A0A7R9IR28_9NEOP|nr:unnamed protein product [Timema tahoe]
MTTPIVILEFLEQGLKIYLHLHLNLQITINVLRLTFLHHLMTFLLPPLQLAQATRNYVELPIIHTTNLIMGPMGHLLRVLLHMKASMNLLTLVRRVKYHADPIIPCMHLM